MNKNELVDRVSNLTKLTKADCQRIIDAVIGTTRNKVQNGEEVRLVGFGTFVRSKRSARKGRNPQTGEEIYIPSQWVPKFRPGKEFREYLR